MLDKRIEEFVRSLSNDVRHSGRNFYDHLRGTHDLLEMAGASKDVCLAGLCHSIYGTNVFKHAVVSITDADRDRVASMIGNYAERLAYIFCSSNRPVAFIEAAERGAPYWLVNRRNGDIFMLSTRELYDLLQIEGANLAEQGSTQMIPRVLAAMKETVAAQA